MKVVFFGTSGFGLPSLEALARSAHTLSAVVTQPDRPSGRDLSVLPSPVKKWALERGLPVLEFTKASEKDIAGRLRTLAPDVLVVISFGHLLKRELLGLPKVAALNVHASLLPRWRGASPMQSAILAGDSETGVCVMRLVEALDAGDILLSRRIPLTADDTLSSLEPKLAALGGEALLEGLELLAAGRAVWTAQEASRVTVCSKIKKEDGRLVWSRSAVELERQVRAFLRWPGSYTRAAGRRLVVKKSRAEALSAGPPGRVTDVSDAGVRVACGAGSLLLTELQQEGRKAMPAADFLRGFPLKTGDTLL